MDEFLILLQAKLDEAKSKGNVNADIKELQNQLDKLKVQVEIDPKSLTKIVKQLGSTLGQKINIPNIIVDSKVGEQIGNNVADNIANGISKASGKVDAEVQKLANQVNKIQLSMTDKSSPKDNYELQIKKLTDQLSNLGLTNEEVSQKTRVLTEAQAELKKVIDSTNYNSINEKNQAILSANEKRSTALNQVKNAYEDAKLAYDKYMQPVSNEKATSLINRINSFLTKNTKITNDAKVALQGYTDELSRGVNLSRWNEINGVLKKTENSMRGLGRLGASLKDQMSQAAQSFTQWLSVSSVVMLGVSKTKEAISEIKELDNILTEISKTSDMTSQQLKQLGMDAYDAASKYGRTASDYLLGVQEMARSGFYGEKGAAMAEQSLLAQSACDMTADLANNYILATNAAYKLNGESDKLNAVLDGQNSITNRNSVAMADMATAMSEAGTVASSYRVSVEDLSAMIGTIESVTKLGGSEVGNAIKAILINLQNVTSDKIVDTLDAANASMTEFVNGAEKLRNPIDILRDLAKTFNQLDEDDPLRAEILTNIGQKYHAAKLGALLQNMEMFDKMLVDYSEGTGSALEESNKSAENLTGTLNKLSNSWTEFVNNIINSDGLKAGINLINKLVEGATSLTSTLGSLGTIGLGAGLFTSIKNVGMA